MARPVKTGLDYFPKDTGSFSDRKIRRLLNEFGTKGYAIYDCILCEIYSGKGYYVKRDNEFDFDIADILGDGITENLVKEVVEGCFRSGLFYKELFDKYSVLTSSGIQKRYVLAKKNGVIMETMRVNSDETPIDSETSTQSKVNESKAKQSKGEQGAQTFKIKIRENVFLKEEECLALIRQYTQEDIDWMYDKLSANKIKTGTEYKSDYGAILSWVVDALKEKIQKEKNSAKKSNNGFSNASSERISRQNERQQLRDGLNKIFEHGKDHDPGPNSVIDTEAVIIESGKNAGRIGGAGGANEANC